VAGGELTGGWGAGPGAVVEAYTAAVAERIDAPASMLVDIRDEVADGLSEAIEGYRRLGLSPDDAARAAVAEFGEPTAMAAALRTEVRLACARRTGLRLMVTGPVVGLLWIAAVLTAGRSAGSTVPTGLWMVLPVIAVAVAVGAASSEFAVAASGRLSRWLSRPALASAAAGVACGAALVTDLTIVGAAVVEVLVRHGAFSPVLLLLAVVASLVRTTFTGRTVFRSLARIHSN
jgi:hypothetical protein